MESSKEHSSTSDLYDVIIAGAGPVGLLLAGELALQNVSVVVLEKDSDPKSGWKSLPMGRRGLNTLSFEALYRRGLLGKVLDANAGGFTGISAKPKISGHFAGMWIDSNKVELERWKYRLDGPALRGGPTSLELMEATLGERAESLGAKIIRGSGFSKIVNQDSHSVTTETSDNRIFHGKWLVGCDGGRSAVRRDAGFEFVGTEPKFTGYIAHCEFDHPEKLKMGFHLTKTGLYIIAPQSLYVVDFDDAAFDRSQEIKMEHLQEVFSRVSGMTGVNITKVHLSSAFTDRAKQTATYRKGRVLVAGDAAHIHSPLGAQGLNLGLGDAMNLGWKLAATIRQEASSSGNASDLALLDSYERERHPIGEWALEWTRAQVVTIQPNLFGTAVQAVFRDLINTTDGANFFADRLNGLSNRYNLGDDEAHAHPLVGCSSPDFEFDDGSRLGLKLVDGKGLLVDFKDDGELKKLVLGTKYENRIGYLGMGAKNQCDVRALLVRPDGFVAWVTDDQAEPNVGALKAALERWFAS